MNTIKCYALFLEGQGDTFVTLVNEATWLWVTKNAPCPQAQKDQLLAVYIKDINKNTTMAEIEEEIKSQKGDNDKALTATPDYGEMFTSLKDYTKFVRKNNVEIVEEYEGYIY